MGKGPRASLSSRPKWTRFRSSIVDRLPLMPPGVSEGIEKFPQEIIEQVIDHLHDDKENLVSCSVVSRRWVARSRYRRLQLATALVIKLESDEHGFLHVLRFLHSSSISSFNRIERLTLSSPYTFFHFAWPQLCSHVLGSILSRLPRLRILVISHVQFGHRLKNPFSRRLPRYHDNIFDNPCRAHYVPPAPFKLDVLKLTHIGSVFDDMKDLIRFFRLFSDVSNLTISSIYTLYWDSSSVQIFAKKCPGGLSHIRAETMYASWSLPMLYFMCETPMIHSLRNLEVACRTFDEVKSLGAYIGKSGEHITNLTIGLPTLFFCLESWGDHSRSLDLSPCTQLNSLTIRLSLRHRTSLWYRMSYLYESRHAALCKWIPQVLSTIPDTIVHFTFHIVVQNIYEVECLAKNFDWHRLDHNLDGAANVQRVTIYYVVWFDQRELPLVECVSSPFISAGLVGLLPLLCARGIVRLKWGLSVKP